MKRGLGQTNLIGITTGLFLLAATAGFAKPHVGGLAELYSWREDSVNLVKNSSFEQVDEAGRVSGWKVGQPGHFFPVTDVARSGLRSMYLMDSHLARYYPTATQPLELTPGWYNMRGWIKAEGAGTNKKGAGGRISLRGAGATQVISGTTAWIQVERRSIVVLPGPSPMLRLQAYRKPNGSVFFDDIEINRLIPPVVEGFLLYPNYRGLLFDDRPQTIRMSVTVRPQEAKARLSDLTIRLSLSKVVDGVDFTVASIEENPSKPSYLMTLDAGNLLAGAYTLRLQALHRRTGMLVFEYPSYRIVKAPSAWRSALGTYIDSDNVLVLGGKRTFVLGIYDTGGYSNSPRAYEPRIFKIAEAPFNLYLNYWLGKAPYSALEALMNVLQRHGMYYLHTVNSWYTNHKQRPESTMCRGQSADSLGMDTFSTCMAAELGSNPGLAGWYTADERPASQAERVFGQYKILRQHDPDGVTFIAQNKLREIVRWRDASDVMGVDPYPIYNIPEGSLSSFEMVTDWVEAAQEAVERSRPVWGVIQFFKFGSKGHWPTYDELRTMSYMAIVAGAKGLFYWSYGAKGLSWVKDPQRKEKLWQRLVKVTKEIKSLEPALISPDAPEVLSALRIAQGAGKRTRDDKSTDNRTKDNSNTVYGTRRLWNRDREAIRVLSKRVGGTRYVIAVNNTPREVQAEFMLAEQAGIIEVVGEARTIAPSAKRSASDDKGSAPSPMRYAPGGYEYSDVFAPYATHVYKIPAPSVK